MVFKVNGIKHHNFIFPSEKDFIFLMPEPDNIFDSNAVGMYNKYHQRIGYVPIRNNYNEKMLRLLQTGSPFLCKIILSNESHQFILIDILIPETINKAGKIIETFKKFRMN